MNAQSPGVMVEPHDTPDALRLRQFVGAGYEWISYQVQNGDAVLPCPDGYLDDAKAAGFRDVGVWGVTYARGEVVRHATALGRQAKRLGAQHVMADLEEFFKNTRDTKVDASGNPSALGKSLGQWYVGAVQRERGSPFPVDLTTLGSPTDPVRFDYAMDTQPFIDSGGALLAQAYLVEAAEYTPANCVTYWKRFVPVERINVMIGLYEKGIPPVRFDGAAHVPLLQQAGVRRNVSIFLQQHASSADLVKLEPFTRPASPVPVPVDPAEVNRAISREAHRWLDLFPAGSKPLSRLQLIDRIARSTDGQWAGARDLVADALGDAGIA